MAPHAVALRTLGLATIVYAAVLLVQPAMGLRAVYAAGPVYAAIVKQDMQATEQQAAAAIDLDQVANAARRQMLLGAWERVAPAVVLSAVGLLGGALLALRRRAGPWTVLVFALWPAATWAVRRALALVSPPRLDLETLPARAQTIQLRLLGKGIAVDAATYASGVRVAFVLVTLGILAWAFVAGRRAAAQVERRRTLRGADEA